MSSLEVASVGSPPGTPAMPSGNWPRLVFPVSAAGTDLADDPILRHLQRHGRHLQNLSPGHSSPSSVSMSPILPQLLPAE